MTPGFGMAIASGLCGLAQGKAIAGSAEAMARNPSATNAIRGALILGLILIESLALYTLVIIFLRVNSSESTTGRLHPKEGSRSFPMSLS